MKKNEITYISGYVSGLFNMASNCFKNIGHSYIGALCFSKENLKEELLKYYKIKEKDIKIHEIDNDIKKVFANLYLNEKNVLEGLDYWLRIKLGDIEKIYEEDEDGNLTDLLSFSEGGNTNFYIVENVYFIEFKKIIVLIIIGNNE